MFKSLHFLPQISPFGLVYIANILSKGLLFFGSNYYLETAKPKLQFPVAKRKLREIPVCTYYFLSESKMVPTPTNSFSKNTSFFSDRCCLYFCKKAPFFVQNVSFQKMDMTKKEEFCFSLFCNFTRHLCRQLTVSVRAPVTPKEEMAYCSQV